MVGAGVVADANHQIALFKVLQQDGAFPHADAGRQSDAGRLMAHIGAVGKVVAAVLAGEQLIEESRLVGGAARGIELDLIRVAIALQTGADLLERLLPAQRLVMVAGGIILQR